MSIQDLDTHISFPRNPPMSSTEEKKPSPPSAEAETETENASPVPTPQEIKLCGVCHKKKYRYTCPRCLLRYCSLPCSTIHKQTHANDPPAPPPPAQPTAPPISTTNPRLGTAAAAGYKGPFAGLEESEELRELFTRYPRLREQLGEILSATQRPEGDGREQGRYGGKKEVWTPEGGMERGVKALGRARGMSDGEGVREFSRLVLRIVEGEKGEGVWKEDVEESVRVVERLLRGEM